MHSKNLDIETLDAWLWDVAKSTHGATDTLRYKDFILPLIFFKRLSDVFDDEFVQYSAKFGSEEAAKAIIEADHQDALKTGHGPIVRFYIPLDYRWNAIRNHPADGSLREFVTSVMREVARLNPELRGVLDITDYAEQQTGRPTLDDNQLATLIQIISRLRLGLNETEPAVFGRAFEHLLQKFATTEREGTTETTSSITAKEVGWLTACLLDPQPYTTIYDPACGSAGLLVKARLVFEQLHPAQKSAAPRLFGQELNPTTFAVAKMNMFLHDYNDSTLALGDVFCDPAFVADASLMQFDYVVAEPPWHQYVDNQIYDDNQWHRFIYGSPPRSSADWGWIQHMLASLKPTGRMAIILDRATLSRTGAEEMVRRAIIEDDLIECVIALPAGVFYGAGPGCLILFNKDKPKERKARILFICSEKGFEKARGRYLLRDEGLQAILNAYKDFRDVDNFASVISLDVIRNTEHSLDFEHVIHLSPLMREASHRRMHFAELGEISEPIGPAQAGRSAAAAQNTVYLPVSGTAPVVTSTNEFTLKPQNYVQFVLKDTIARADFVAGFFNSQLGSQIREAIRSGSSWLVSRRQLLKTPVYLPSLEEQDEIIKASNLIVSRSAALEGGEVKRIAELHRELWKDPDRRAQIVDRAELIGVKRKDEPAIRECLEASDEFFDIWLESLPYPLARILWRYTAKQPAEDKINLLLSFFESLAVFNSLVMLSAFAQDTAFYDQESRAWLDQENYEKRFIKPSFGDWNELASRLAKATREVRKDLQKKDKLLSLFGGPGWEELIEAVTRKKLNDVLSGASNYRNLWRGHGSAAIGKKGQNIRLEEMKKLLIETHKTICHRYSAVLLFTPKSHDMERDKDGVHNYIVKVFKGTRRPIQERDIQSRSELKSGSLYLAPLESDEPLIRPITLLPFVQLKECKGEDDVRPEIDAHAFYFYSGLNKDEVRWISHDCPEMPEISSSEDLNLVTEAINWLKYK